jgi:hypothetical protein
MRRAYKIVVRKPKRKKIFGRFWPRRDDNIKKTPWL